MSRASILPLLVWDRQGHSRFYGISWSRVVIVKTFAVFLDSFGWTGKASAGLIPLVFPVFCLIQLQVWGI